MCLGISMQIISIDGYNACCEAKGVRRDVNLFVLQHEKLQAGDYVLVHVGYAIQKISPQHPADSWQLIDRLSDANGGPKSA